jgi:hypothetical protein
MKETISGSRKAFKSQKQAQQVGQFFQTLNNTIHQAAPFIEYAFDAASAKFSKVNLDFLCRFFKTDFI